MRLIDADKLEIRKFTDSEIRGYDHGVAYRIGWNDAIDSICENEPTIEPQKWIPCSERLPEENGERAMDICTDNRFEIIKIAKQDLLDATNIASSPEEMAVIDNVLFRCWQMGWLDRYEAERRE